MQPPTQAGPPSPARAKLSTSSIVHWSSKPISATVGEEIVLMNLDRGRCYGLGPVGTDLWNKLEHSIRVSDLIAKLQAEYEVEPAVLEHDVLATLEQYASEGLIEVNS